MKSQSIVRNLIKSTYMAASELTVINLAEKYERFLSSKQNHSLCPSQPLRYQIQRLEYSWDLFIKS